MLSQTQNILNPTPRVFMPNSMSNKPRGFGNLYFMTTSDYVKNLSLQDIEGEIWKTIRQSPFYMVSTFGRVKAIERIKLSGKYHVTKKEGIRKQSIADTGYYRIRIECLDVKKTFKVHRLIAEAFIPNKENKKCINHIDGNKLNNSITNLEWCTHSENLLHAWENGLNKGMSGKENAGRAKPVIQMDLDGNFIKRWNSGTRAAKSLNMAQGNLSQCLLGMGQKTFGGFTWKFA